MTKASIDLSIKIYSSKVKYYRRAYSMSPSQFTSVLQQSRLEELIKGNKITGNLEISIFPIELLDVQPIISKSMVTRGFFGTNRLKTKKI